MKPAVSNERQPRALALEVLAIAQEPGAVAGERPQQRPVIRKRIRDRSGRPAAASMLAPTRPTNVLPRHVTGGTPIHSESLPVVCAVRQRVERDVGGGEPREMFFLRHARREPDSALYPVARSNSRMSCTNTSGP